MPRLGLGVGIGVYGASGNNALNRPKAPFGANYALLSHPTYWASDASHLTPCTAGTSIRWWKDAVTGTWYEQAASGSRFIARQDAATGKWYAEGDGTKIHRWVDLSAFPKNNATFAVATRAYSNVNYNVFISNNNGSGTPAREFLFISNTVKPAIMINNNGGFVTAPIAINLNADYRILSTMGGTTALYINGSSVASSADTSSANFSTATDVGGRTGNGGVSYNGRFYGVLIATSNSINVAAWDAALQGYCTS